MKTSLLSLLISGALVATCSAEIMEKELTELAKNLATLITDNGKKKVTVLDFTDIDGGGSGLGKYIAEELTMNLVIEKRDFLVLDRANLASILREHKLTATGLIDPQNAKKLGQFAGVDALILGVIVPQSDGLRLNAKIITTDTAEIAGATRISVKTNAAIQQLLERPAVANNPLGPRPKQFGDLELKVQDLRMLPGNNIYGFGRLTFVITNTSDSKAYGVALASDEKLSLLNDRNEEFFTTGISGVEQVFLYENGRIAGKLTEVLPRTAINLVADCQIRWSGKPGDYRPYSFRAVVVFAADDQGRYPEPKKHVVTAEIK